MAIENESLYFLCCLFHAFTHILNFLWILKSICLFLGNSSCFYTFINIENNCLICWYQFIKIRYSTLPMTHSWSWYVANIFKTHKLACYEKYYICLKIWKTSLYNFDFLQSVNIRICKYFKQIIVIINYNQWNNSFK